MKLHLGCGDVYLTGFINLDIRGEYADADTEGTTLVEYYKGRTIGAMHPTIIDERLDVPDIPWRFESASVDEVVMIQSIEHFTPKVAANVIREIERIMIPGGVLKIDFPDVDLAVKHYIDKDPTFCMRLIYGSHKYEHFFDHKWGYTCEMFSGLLGDNWQIEFGEIVKHDYPVIGCTATFGKERKR